MSATTTTDALLTKFVISHTPGVDRSVGEEERTTIAGLADLAKQTKARSKEALPMIVAGAFGPSRARTNDNMRTVSVIMGDYDAGVVTPAAAAEKLAAAGIEGAIITSPRHMVETTKGIGPRWRVICPLSEPVSFRAHAALARKLNGVFGQDVLGTEGLSASRPYYYGSLDGQPDCETHIVTGRTLDLAGDIPELKFPKSPHEDIEFPEIEAGVDVARAVLDMACAFEGGHEGLRPACLMVAPFIKVRALDGEEAAERLQRRLEATSSRNDVPDDEATRTLIWALASERVKTAVQGLDLAVLFGELTPEDAADTLVKVQEAWAEDPKAASKVVDFMLNPLPPETAEEQEKREAKEAAFKAERDAEDKAKAEAKPRYKFLTYDDLCAMPEPAWLVEGLIPLPSFGVIWGEYASLKSYWILDVMTHIALGKDYGGRRVEEGRCFYLLGEGLFDARYRLAAAFQKHGVAPNANVLLMDRAVLLLNAGDVDGFIRAVKEQELLDHVPTRLIVIDTIARALPGQNSSAVEVMTAATEAADKIKREIGCSVCLIGHAGKDRSKGLMGSVATPAAVDYEFSTERQKAPQHVLTVANVKQKYAPEAPDMWFDVQVTDLDAGRDALTLHERVQAPAKPRAEVSEKRTALFSHIQRLIEAADAGTATVDAVVAAAEKDEDVTAAGNTKDRRKNIRKMLRMMDGNEIVVRGEVRGDGVKVMAGADAIYLGSDPRAQPEPADVAGALTTLIT